MHQNFEYPNNAIANYKNNDAPVISTPERSLIILQPRLVMYD